MGADLIVDGDGVCVQQTRYAAVAVDGYEEGGGGRVEDDVCGDTQGAWGRRCGVLVFVLRDRTESAEGGEASMFVDGVAGDAGDFAGVENAGWGQVRRKWRDKRRVERADLCSDATSRPLSLVFRRALRLVFQRGRDAQGFWGQ